MQARRVQRLGSLGKHRVANLTRGGCEVTVKDLHMSQFGMAASLNGIVITSRSAKLE